MKKTIIIFVIILSILGVVAFIAAGNLSRIGSYIIGKITGGWLQYRISPWCDRAPISG